jgi:pimeloyl-ACP methyl ester carboxylesterase
MTVHDARTGREYERADAGPGRAALPRTAAFWLVAAVLFLLFFAAAAPSPLYGVYQARWRFSATTLTAVFAAYAVLLLVTLLVFGPVSDYLGRRRVILAGLAMAAGACGLFLAADSVGLLFAARALHGAAVGTATSALGAALIDLQPQGSKRAPVITTAAALLGLAVGGLGTSALVQYGPAPTRLIWWLLLGADLAAAGGVLAMPETAPRRPGVLASLRPRVAVPREVRGTFARALPCLIAVWMISGFYLSLGPSLAAQVLRSPDLLWGGLVIFLLNGIGTAAAVVASRASGPAAMLAGCLLLLPGTVLTLAAIQTPSGAAFLAGTGVAGAGFGTGMLGVFRTISAQAAPGQRASLIAAYFIASYTAFSIPVVAAGVATTHVGLHKTALAYCATIAVLAAAAAAGLIFRGRSAARRRPRGAVTFRIPRRGLAPQDGNKTDHEGIPKMNARANIVLIHGAWAEGSCWSGVIERLQADGYHVTAPQFPLTALADDVARLRQVLELQDGPTIVAGHSYGGQVMTALGADAPNVAGLVYIAAFGLDQGESLGGLLSQGPVTPALAHLFTDKQGFGWLSEDDFVNHFAADVDPVKARVMYAVQQPLAMSAFGDVMGVPAWKTLPSWYLVATDDQALPPDAERGFARRMGATTVEIPSSHVAMVSHPGDVAELIKTAAEAV